MAGNSNPVVVGIRFGKLSKIYNFDATGLDEIHLKDLVVVETCKGKQIGEVVKIYQDYEMKDEPLKKVERIATAGELVSNEFWNLRKKEVLEYCEKRAAELNLKDIRILNAEFNYDGSYMILTYSSPTEEKVDLKSLKYDIQKSFSINNIEIKQIGPRDVAKVIGGMGACGIPCRCCSSFLTDFSSISIKMAKEQGISLTPSEITGMCGRLRCCLEYENEYYAECRKNLPKKKKKVITPQGEGKVVEIFPLRHSVLVEIPCVGRREFTADQIKFDEIPAKQDDSSKEEEEAK